MQDCIFCQIVEGKAPCHKVWEDDKHIAFLSIFPNTEGFTVVATKRHYDSYVFDQDDGVIHGLVMACKRVGKLLDNALEDVGRTGLVFEGFGVNHLHAKLFPMHGTKNTGGWKPILSSVDKYFEKYEGYISTHGGKRADDKKLQKLAEKIRGC